MRERTRFKGSSRANPCPVCGGNHKCSIGTDGLIACGRRQGEQPDFVHLGAAQKDPQYHLYRREGDPVLEERQREYEASKPKVHFANGRAHNWHDLAAKYQAALTPTRRDELAADLGVPADVLSILQVGFKEDEDCWTFPERDGTGRIVGINRRWKDAQKKLMAGGSRGLYIPPAWRERGGTIFCPEGASNTLAMWAMGLSAVGRPNNRAAVADLALQLSDLPNEQNIVIVGDFDAKRTGEWPGRDGACQVAGELSVKLNRSVLWTLPPLGKDVREWLSSQDFDRSISDAWHVCGEGLEGALRKSARPPLDPESFPFPDYIGGNGNDSECEGVPERWKIVACSELEKRPDEERWVWEGCIARGLITQFNALFKVGKTTLLAHLLRCLEDGGMFCGRPCHAAKILYVTEEPDDNWVDRRDELGLNDHIHFIRNPFLTKPPKKDWLRFIAYIIGQVRHESYDLVVFDTISNLWPVKDENNSCEVQEALMPLRGLPGTTALLLVHHIRKSDGSEGTAGRGTSAFGGYVDIILEIRRYNASEKKDTRRTLTGYGRPKSVPQEDVLRLDETGYVLDGDKSTVQTKELVPLLERLIPQGEPGSSKTELLDAIKEERGSGVRHELLVAALKQGIDEGRWAQAGKKPKRYFRPAKEE
jgi:hypothetical protein